MMMEDTEMKGAGVVAAEVEEEDTGGPEEDTDARVAGDGKPGTNLHGSSY